MASNWLLLKPWHYNKLLLLRVGRLPIKMYGLHYFFFNTRYGHYKPVFNTYLSIRTGARFLIEYDWKIEEKLTIRILEQQDTITRFTIPVKSTECNKLSNLPHQIQKTE